MLLDEWALMREWIDDCDAVYEDNFFLKQSTFSTVLGRRVVAGCVGARQKWTPEQLRFQLGLTRIYGVWLYDTGIFENWNAFWHVPVLFAPISSSQDFLGFDSFEYVES